jgi:hypothetical protein
MGSPHGHLDQPSADLEKSASTHQEVLQKDGARPEGDYSGAVAKTDPAEVKLVRKLDIWIMVSKESLHYESI